jgi:hypothetical protein
VVIHPLCRVVASYHSGGFSSGQTEDYSCTKIQNILERSKRNNINIPPALHHPAWSSISWVSSPSHPRHPIPPSCPRCPVVPIASLSPPLASVPASPCSCTLYPPCEQELAAVVGGAGCRRCHRCHVVPVLDPRLRQY